jgi:hypothetical protein
MVSARTWPEGARNWRGLALLTILPGVSTLCPEVERCGITWGNWTPKILCHAFSLFPSQWVLKLPACFPDNLEIPLP